MSVAAKLKGLQTWVTKHGVLGTLRQMKMTKDLTTGDLKGVDALGNKYYENVETQISGRTRWVVYANPKDVNASNIPSEWHAWMHYSSDTPSVNSEQIPFKLAHQPTVLSRLGAQANHLPPGHILKGAFKPRYVQWSGKAAAAASTAAEAAEDATKIDPK